MPPVSFQLNFLSAKLLAIQADRGCGRDCDSKIDAYKSENTRDQIGDRGTQWGLHGVALTMSRATRLGPGHTASMNAACRCRQCSGSLILLLFGLFNLHQTPGLRRLGFIFVFWMDRLSVRRSNPGAGPAPMMNQIEETPCRQRKAALCLRRSPRNIKIKCLVARYLTPSPHLTTETDSCPALSCLHPSLHLLVLPPLTLV